MQFIQFKQTNIFLKGTGVDGGTEKESVSEFKQYIDYLPDQLVTDKYALFPEIDITPNVNLMGDIFSQDTLLMKAYSTFEIQIDYYQLMYKAKE